MATKNAKNLTAAVQALSAVKSPTEFFELQQKLIKDGVEAAVVSHRPIDDRRVHRRFRAGEKADRGGAEDRTDLVARYDHGEGCKLLSLMRTSFVVKCHGDRVSFVSLANPGGDRKVESSLVIDHFRGPRIGTLEAPSHSKED